MNAHTRCRGPEQIFTCYQKLSPCSARNEALLIWPNNCVKLQVNKSGWETMNGGTNSVPTGQSLVRSFS